MEITTIKSQKISAYTGSRRRRRWNRFIKVMTPHLVLLPLAGINLFPIFFMFISSFKGGMEYFRNQVGLPWVWTFENYHTLFFERDFLRQVGNSMIVSFSTVIITLAIAALAAYAFSWLKFRGREAFFNLAVALMSISVVVTIVPLFALMSRLQLINKYPSAILVYVGFCLPFSIYIFRGFFSSLPVELLDAARVDGAGHLHLIWYIILPLASAPMVTLALINGLWVWNELLIALMFLQSETSTTIMASLARGTSRDVRNIPLITAGAFAASLPVLFLIGYGQRYFVRGFLGGSIK